MSAPRTDLQDVADRLAREGSGMWVADACGITRGGTQLPALVHREAYSFETPKRRVLVIGGMSGGGQDVEAVAALASWYAENVDIQASVALSVVLCGYPDGVGAGVEKAGDSAVAYPPVDRFFFDENDPEARYLWRWAGFMAPDALLEVVVGDSAGWEATDPAGVVGMSLDARGMNPGESLLAALGSGHPNRLGAVPGFRITGSADAVANEGWKFLERLKSIDEPTPSPARVELGSRRRRDVIDVARLLAGQYGYTLDPLVYTQGVAISGRLRVAQLDAMLEETAADIVRLVEPLVTDADTVLEGSGGQHLAGLVWCDELAAATADQRYHDLLVSAADRFVGNPPGDPPPPCDRNYRTEDMFFAAAILGRAFDLTRDAAYMDLLTGFLLAGEVQQADGLFWHADDVPFYWGRGNGFAAMGFAEALTYMDENHTSRGAVLSAHRRHLEALRAVQRPSGMLTQILNVPGSYHEHTATSMVGYAVARGVRLGWLDESFRPFADSLWTGACQRIDSEGGLVDGCAGTGPQPDERSYLDRPATFGYDDRTGNLALWFAVEMERLARG